MVRFIELITKTLHNYEKHEGSSHAAAIAYHATISLGPLLLFSIGLASRAFGREAAVNQVIVGVANVAGRAMADFVSSLNEQLSRPTSDNFLLSMLSLGITIYAASNVFRQLVIALNAIWEVPLIQVDIRDGVWRWAFIRLRKYFIGLVVAMVTIVSLLVSMLVGIFWETILHVSTLFVPRLGMVLGWIGVGTLPIVLVLLCLLAFKILPRVDLTWRAVWPGALLTGLVLSVAEVAIGYYVSHSWLPSLYGLTSSVVVLMLWAYFSAIIFLLGAEFTHIYSRRLQPSTNGASAHD